MRLCLLLLLSITCIQITRRIVPAATLQRYESAPMPLDAWAMRLFSWGALLTGALTGDGANLPAEIAGFSMFLVGQGFIAWAMRENRYYLPIIITPTVVCTTGPYKYFRHPAYLGHAISHIGAWMLWRSPYALPFVLAILGVLVWRSRREYQLIG